MQTESDLRPEWFGAASAVGITAGTSTPDDVIDRIDERIRALGASRCVDAPDTVPDTVTPEVEVLSTPETLVAVAPPRFRIRSSCA